MNTTQLECFMAVSNFLNFSRAAEHLRLTQPAVSHQINSLEDELGVKLFHRTSKRVRLTQAGHLFSQYAQEILSLSHLSKERLKESRQTSVIPFGIGCHSFLELERIKPVLKQLRVDFPLLLPALRLVSSASLENLLEDGEVQVMLTFQDNSPKRAVYRELSQQRIVCICAECHPFASHEVLSAQQLRTGERFAACLPHSGPHPLLELQSRIITGALRIKPAFVMDRRPCIPWWKPDTPLQSLLICPALCGLEFAPSQCLDTRPSPMGWLTAQERTTRSYALLYRQWNYSLPPLFPPLALIHRPNNLRSFPVFLLNLLNDK